MKELGEQLKARRQELNLSLKEVENSTSIRMSYLQAIEAGDVSRLISHIYAQGFVKQYATFLGMDGEQVVRDNSQLFGSDAKQVFDYGIGTLEHRGTPGGGVGSLPGLAWLAAFGGILLLAWFLAKFLELI